MVHRNAASNSFGRLVSTTPGLTRHSPPGKIHKFLFIASSVSILPPLCRDLEATHLLSRHLETMAALTWPRSLHTSVNYRSRSGLALA